MMSQWWIDKPKFLGSSNPTTDELKELSKQGFRTIVSLLDESEQRLNYDAEAQEAIRFDLVPITIRDLDDEDGFAEAGWADSFDFETVAQG